MNYKDPSVPLTRVTTDGINYAYFFEYPAGIFIRIYVRRWMMKNFFFILSVFVFLFAPGLCVAAEEEPHPEITLIDYDGNEISLDSNIPYSPKNTCGECHDYDAITNAYHFQQGRTDADGEIIVGDDLDSRNPWLLSRGMYGKW